MSSDGPMHDADRARSSRASSALPRTDSHTTVDRPEAGDAMPALAQWLRTQTDARAVRVVGYARLSGGAIQDNSMLDVEIEGGPWQGRRAFVLRTDAPSRVASSLTRRQEYAVLQVAHAAGVKAPKPLFFCDDERIIGREFFVMERLPGIAAAHRLTREPALVPDANALAHALGANLALLHAIRPPRVALEALPPPPANPAHATIAACRAHLDALHDAHPALEWGLRWCELHAPQTFDVVLTHGDYRTGNYLVDGGHLVGVLDWEFAGWGDPRADLGWFTARCWRFAGQEREGGGIADLAPFIAGYASVAGRGISRSELDYWQVVAHLRWAIIALQQAQRHLAGGERSLELALTGRIVHELEYQMLEIVARSFR